MWAAQSAEPGSVDVVARAAALVAVGISVINFLLGRRDLGWARRTARLGILRDALCDLRAVLSSDGTAEEVAGRLWTPRCASAVESLADEAQGVADRRLRRQLGQVVEACVTGRGTQPSRFDAYAGTGGSRPLDTVG